MQINDPHYVQNGASNAATGSYKWLPIDGMMEVGFHISSDSFTGTYVWEATGLYDQPDPNKVPPTAGQISLVTLVAAEQTLSAPAAVAVNHIFMFGQTESTNVSKLPIAKWMRMRSTRSAGGSATGLNIGVTRKGND